MNLRKYTLISIGVLLVSLVAIPDVRVAAGPTTTVVTPASPDWSFYNDDVVGVGVGELVVGQAPVGFGLGSAHFTLDATARMALGTYTYAGLRMNQITTLQYRTYNSVVNLQFNIDYDLNDADNTTWQGRLVYIPGASTPGAWQTWSDLLTTGMWYSTGNPGKSFCASSCTWAQVLSHWPNAGIRRLDSGLFLKAGGPAPGFDGYADALTINDVTYDFEPGATQVAFQVLPASTTLIPVGGTSVMMVSINSVRNLYGYQFIVHYDKDKVHATGAFAADMPWFDTTTNVLIPPAWNHVCDDAVGTCSFAVSKSNPAPAVNGSGRVVFIQFTGVGAGISPLTFSDDVLSDIDGTALAHGIGTAGITVYGTASASGNVILQGRPTPYDALGKVLLTDLSGTFPPVQTTIAVNGSWSASIPALPGPGGTNYQIDASHTLYLGNRIASQNFKPGDAFAAPTTKLLGGDANNNGTVEVGDLACIGGDFNGAPGNCGGTGSSDINADGKVNIQDLAIVGGNYDLSTPLTW